MSQFGNLSLANQTAFLDYQDDPVRVPTSAVSIAGFGDLSDVLSIETFQGLETGISGIYSTGKASVIVRNTDGIFFSNGRSNVDVNARLQIWAGFKRELDLKIPIFSGIVRDVRPSLSDNTVEFDCSDYMQIFQDNTISGSQDPYFTPKDIVDFWASDHSLVSSITSNSEITTAYTQPTFDQMSQKLALEKVGLSIFSIFYFDEDGTLRVKEKEYTNPVDWLYNKRNVINAYYIEDTPVINAVSMEYRDRFLAYADDLDSIGRHKRHGREYLLNIINDLSVSSLTSGEGSEIPTTDEVAVRIDPAIDGSLNCVLLKLSRTTANGLVYVKIYSDSSGPDALLGTSQAVACGGFPDDHGWITFYFRTPIALPVGTYWISFDLSNISGNLQFKYSEVAKTGYHATYNGSAWSLVNNKRMLYRARGSWESQRVLNDLIRFHKDPHEMIRIIAPAVLHLQRFDEVYVDAETEDQEEIIGRYVITQRRHVIGDGHTTIDTLRRIG